MLTAQAFLPTLSIRLPSYELITPVSAEVVCCGVLSASDLPRAIAMSRHGDISSSPDTVGATLGLGCSVSEGARSASTDLSR